MTARARTAARATKPVGFELHAKLVGEWIRRETGEGHQHSDCSLVCGIGKCHGREKLADTKRRDDCHSHTFLSLNWGHLVLVESLGRLTEIQTEDLSKTVCPHRHPLKNGSTPHLVPQETLHCFACCCTNMM